MNTEKKSRSGDRREATYWAAVETRDKTYDDRFYYSVASTGVYCRPSCPSRQAKRANVRFHASAAEAEAAGFRPCRRCRPDRTGHGQSGDDRSEQSARRASLIEAACRSLERDQPEMTLKELARRAGLSSSHFQRLFKSIVGVTPKAYAMTLRRLRVRDELTRTSTVTEAMYNAGYTSSSRFYENGGPALGMAPRDFKAGGARTAITYTTALTWLGQVAVAATDNGVCAVLIGDDPNALAGDLARRFPNAAITKGGHAFKTSVAKVLSAIKNPAAHTALPLDIQGTAFQKRVWDALRDIPPGTTATYSGIAAKIGRPKSVRAVARACGANPVAVLVPCHRVVAADGRLTGYRWGTDRKGRLLEREALECAAREREAQSTPAAGRKKSVTSRARRD